MLLIRSKSALLGQFFSRTWPSFTSVVSLEQVVARVHAGSQAVLALDMRAEQSQGFRV